VSDDGGVISRFDARLGDVMEAQLRRHHVRRLGKLGWPEVLDPSNGGGWWCPRVPIRDGNDVEVFVDGAAALPAMEAAIRAAKHTVHIAGWHASPDFQLTREPGSAALRDVLAEVAERVPVRLLLWAGPPLPAFEPTRKMVNEARDEFRRDSLVQCEVDSRERTLHCHHEKLVIIDGELAFVGGIDLTPLQGDRYDHSAHPPNSDLGWHDAAARLRGPVVADVGRHFIQRWNEVTHSSLPDPEAPGPAGSTQVQILRTVPERTYRFAPHGEFTILDAYLRALRSAERFIYLENQFLWSPEVVDVLAEKLHSPPADDFRILLVLPAKPSNGADTTRGQLGRLVDADRADRLLATTITGHEDGRSVPVYIHAKIGVIDDRWLTLGSANLNEHSLFNDTEVNLLTCDAELARDTRLRLWAEHTERPVGDVDGEPCRVVDEIWRPTAQEQSRRDAAGLPRTSRLSLLAQVSRRADRLQGPLRGFLVDG
jgi:phosphatidylserine/phosphatidylglycerophosphate/cardiolipin synthase-like enzyme